MPIDSRQSSVIIADLVVAVAQLVESRIVIPVVVGSSPISHPNPDEIAYKFDRGIYS